MQPVSDKDEALNSGGLKPLLRFLVPSVLGVFFFLFPVRYEGGWTIPMGVLSDALTDRVGQYMPAVVLLIVFISALTTIWFSIVISFFLFKCNLHSAIHQIYLY